MTVKELKKALRGIDDNRLVVCSSDAEGNSYLELYCIWEGAYSGGYRGEVGIEVLTEDDIAQGYTEEDVVIDGIPCLVLTPN